MRFSIVTISFNQAPFLERTIQSVLSQEGVEVEYIVVDGGSTDGSREIIQRYADRIAHTVFEPDEGPADALQKGFALATGDILGQLNSDDCYLPRALCRVQEIFEADLDCDVVYGDGVIVDECGAPIRVFISDHFTPKRHVFAMGNVCQQSTFYRKRAYHAAGGINVDNPTNWDGELMVDMGLSGCRMIQLPDILGAFSHHPESISFTHRHWDESVKNHRRIFEKVMRRPRSRFDELIFKLNTVQRIIERPERLIRFFQGHARHARHRLRRENPTAIESLHLRQLSPATSSASVAAAAQ